jgi:hypothetical protein
VLNLELHRGLGAFGQGDFGPNGIQSSGFLFADYGKTYPFRPPNTGLRPYQELGSAGAGLNVAVGSHLYMRATFAYGLTALPGSPRPYALLFQLAASAF